MDGRTDFLTERFLLSIFYVRKVANKAKRTQQVAFSFNFEFIGSFNIQMRFIP